jgi:hypothetical protein
MTAQQFRTIALSLPEAVEVGHMGHPDFRVRNKIFATLGYPSREWAVVKLTLKQQEGLVKAHPAVFVPVTGFWGRRGATTVNLGAATKDVVREALTKAWCNTAPKRLAREFFEPQRAKTRTELSIREPERARQQGPTEDDK